jgi:predicted secreted protein
MHMLTISPRLRRSLSLSVLALAAGSVQAEAPRQNALSFSASATEEVTQDLLVVTLQATREGNLAAEVQVALKQVMESALSEARKAAQGQSGMEVRTGSFSVQPRYTNAGRISGWQGSAQLVLEGTDTTRISQTAGKLTQLNVVNMQYGLSRGLRERHEAALTNEAIQRFRSRASAMAAAFGFKGYTLGEVSVSSTEPGFEPRPYMMAARAKTMEAADAALPVEPGKGRLSVNVNGQVYLTP